MSRSILVHGMKRSGNHAIIQWMLAQGEFTFHNNIVPIAAILRGDRALPAPCDFAAWRAERVSLEQSICASLEDHPPDFRPFCELPADVIQILILRDPENFFASRIRKAGKAIHPAYPREAGPMLNRVVQGWKAHAREFLGLTDHLQNKIPIYFNAWFLEEAYRAQISARLGLDFSDTGYAQVSDVGGGSSFDRTAFNGENRRMKVLERKSQLGDDEAQFLAEVLKDEEMRELGQRVEALAQGTNATTDHPRSG